ncbi:unnamed protein product [Closterium sp. Yama58-4]|nr:unnamed protein product [Closterium sp. Yama58-4]
MRADILPDLNADPSVSDQDLDEVVPTPVEDHVQERELDAHFTVHENEAYYDGIGDPDILIENVDESDVAGMDSNDLDVDEGFEEDYDKSDDEDEEASLARRARAMEDANMAAEGVVAGAAAPNGAPPIRGEQEGVVEHGPRQNAPSSRVVEGGGVESGARQEAPVNVGDGGGAETVAQKEAAAELDSKKDRAKLPLRKISVDTRKHYWFNFLHFKWWVIIFMAMMAENEVPPRERLKVHDEVGFMLGNDKGDLWANVADPWDIHLHGPRVTRWRVIQYIRYLFNETNEQAEKLRKKIRPNKKIYFGKYARASTPFVIKAKMNALGCLGRIEARLYGYSISSTKDWIKEAREFLKLAHQFLGRGCSIRKIRLGNMFVRLTRSTSHVDEELDVFVLVVTSRKTKTNVTNQLSHQFLARHRDWQLCGMGGVFLWLHFLYDLIPLRYGDGIVQPLDFSDPLLWTKMHLFFTLKSPTDPRQQRQDEMPYKTHNSWISWVMKKAEWALSKVTHAFRRSGAQGLSDDGCPDNDIGSLGGWAQGEMRRSYIVGVPFRPVFLQAGFSGDRGDYYIGRSKAKLPRHKDPDKDEWLLLLKLIEKHVFPWVEANLKKILLVPHCQVHAWNARQKDPQNRHYAGDAQFRYTAEEKMQKVYVANDMLRQECGRLQGAYSQAVSQIQSLEGRLAARDLAYAQLLAEFEALKCSGSAHSRGVTASADGAGPSNVSSGSAAAQASAAPKAISPEEAFYKLVVVEWRDAKTVAGAWALWVKKSRIMDGQSLREVRAALERQDKNFFSTFAFFSPSGPNAMATESCDRKMRRMALVMQAVETFRVDSSEEATATAVARLDSVLAITSFRDFTDGLIVGDTLPKKRSRKAMKDGKSTNEHSQRVISWHLVKMRLRDEAWAVRLFGAEWETIKAAEEAKDAAAQAAAEAAAAVAAANAERDAGSPSQ